jgi:hypothetical protein
MRGRVGGVGTWNAATYVTSKLIVCVILKQLHTYGVKMGRRLKRHRVVIRGLERLLCALRETIRD